MTSIKTKEEILKRIKEKFENLVGKEISDEELIEKCLIFSNTHIDELVSEKKKVLELTPELKKEILSGAQNCELYYLDKTDDELIYGI